MECCSACTKSCFVETLVKTLCIVYAQSVCFFSDKVCTIWPSSLYYFSNITQKVLGLGCWNFLTFPKEMFHNVWPNASLQAYHACKQTFDLTTSTTILTLFRLMDFYKLFFVGKVITRICKGCQKMCNIFCNKQLQSINVSFFSWFFLRLLRILQLFLLILIGNVKRFKKISESRARSFSRL